MDSIPSGTPTGNNGSADVKTGTDPITATSVPSGTRPAGKHPRPAPSGTSGTVFGKEVEKEGTSHTQRKLFDNSLPDVPDGRNRLPDGCRTALEYVPDGRAGLVPPVPPSPGLMVQGVLLVGGMYKCRDRHHALENPDLRRVLTQPEAPDTIITAVDAAEATFVDIDVHDWPQPPSAAELAAHVAAAHPEPDAWWRTQGGGAHLTYTGPHHADRALAVAFTIPPDFKVEIKRDTRHPLAPRSDKGGAICGPVKFGDTDPAAPFVFKGVGRLDDKAKAKALDVLGLEAGGRYAHDHCPIDPGADSTAENCVVVLDGGVFCHRCAGHGASYRPGLRPGYVPFGALAGTDTTVLGRLAKSWVHWTHARIELQHFFPNLGEAVLRSAYEKALAAHSRFGDKDPRRFLVFDDDLDFMWGEDLWLDKTKLAPTVINKDAADSMPYCLNARMNDAEKFVISVNRPRRAQVMHRTPKGYTPLRPYKGITFAANEGVVPVQALPAPTHKISLLNEPLSEEDAFAIIEKVFPGVDRIYLKACIAAAICAEAGGGQPPMLCCTGPSGSAKNQTARLAASFLGEDAVRVQVVSNPEEFMRNIGMVVAAGHRFILFDEFGKTPSLSKHLSAVLQIGANIDWRPLYGNQRITTRVRSAFFFPCVRFPEFLHESAEFVRRTRRIHLYRRVPDWVETSGGDTVAWRDRSEANALAANSIVTHVWKDCHDYGFRFL